MIDQLDEFWAVLETGNPDEVNSAIERLGDLEAEVQAELFGSAFEMCLGLSDDSDGYQRQSVVRFARELISRNHLLAIFTERVEEAVPEHLILAGREHQISRLEAFFVASLYDDGRVRHAVINGISNLSAASQMGGDDGRLEGLQETLESLLSETTGTKREHVEQVLSDLQLKCEGPNLAEMLELCSEDM
jgi:hypothetical protein